MQIIPSGQACGATVTGLDVRQPLSTDLVGAIRAAWLQHHVLAFPDQDLTDDDLERFTLHFGGFAAQGHAKQSSQNQAADARTTWPSCKGHREEEEVRKEEKEREE